MDKNIRESWERFLHPSALRTNMIVASLYIAAFEILKDSIITRIRDFFCIGFDQSGSKISSKYRTEVLSRNPSPLYSSLDWLKEAEAISDDDLASFELVKKNRNELAHEMIRLISDGLPGDWPLRFNEMINLLEKIEKWWILNVEIPTNPDYDGQEIDEEGISPGRIMTLKLMIDIALGSEEESMQYFNHFVKTAQDA